MKPAWINRINEMRRRVPQAHPGGKKRWGNKPFRYFRILALLSAVLILSGSVAVLANQPLIDGNGTAENLGVKIDNLAPQALPGVFPLIAQTRDQINPAVAKMEYWGDEIGYLVVWEEAVTETNHDIFGEWFSSEGTSIGLRLEIATTAKNETNPSIAWSPDTERFMVVWEYEYSSSDHDIYARQINTNSAAYPLIYISTLLSDGSSPQVVYNNNAQEFFVVWGELIGSGPSAQSDIYGQRVNANGSKVGSHILIDNDSNDESTPAVSSWETEDGSGYLAAWQDKGTDYDIHAQQISQTGVLMGSEISVMTWQYDQLKPRIACDEKCLLVWEDHHWGWGADSDVYGQRYIMNSSGVIQSDGGYFGIGWDGDLRENPVVYIREECGDDFIVIWEQKTTASSLGIYGRVILKDGTLAGDEVVFSPGTGYYQGLPDVPQHAVCEPLIVWQDGRNVASNGMDIYGNLSGFNCSIHTQCVQGEFCYKQKCLRDTNQAVYHCGKSLCPPGHWCLTPSNIKERCAEDPDYFCNTACDCGPAHCCKNNMCIKDLNDPWIPGGDPVEPACVDQFDPTYCCAFPSCHAGHSAYEADAGLLFRCYDPGSGQTRNYCGGDNCFGTACNCAPGQACVDVITGSPPGKACFMLIGGSCVSNAIAEAVYGWPPAELLACSNPGTPTVNSDFGWRAAGAVAYQRLTGRLSYCGNAVCDAGEYPHSCPADCRCGDGQCAPSEVNICSTDCGTCGDGQCKEWESPYSCPRDCKDSQGDNRCETDEVWSYPGDCTCPDAPYFPQTYTVCGDKYYSGESPLNPERCQGSCPEEYSQSSPATVQQATLNSPQILISRRYGGSQGAIANYFAPDFGRSVIAKTGHIYITGQTFAYDFPGTSSIGNQDWDAVLMKLDYNGNLQFSRYLGKDTGLGHNKYTGRDIALDRSGNIFVAGSMGVTRVSPDGSRFGTYPNSIIDVEGAYGIALDSADNIYLVGSQAYGALKLTPAGAVSYRNSSLGGRAHDIALDGMNNAYVTGTMGFLKLNTIGSAIKLTSLGGTGFGVAYRDGYVYIAGSTNSASFPSTTGAYDTTYDPSGDAFVAVLDSNSNVVYGSYLGGSNFDASRSIAVDDEGRIFVTGVTYSSNFPTSANAVDRNLTGIGDAFVTVIDPAGNGASDLLYSTYLGGGDPNVPPYLMPDRGLGISVDEFGAVYLTGETGSADFPPLTQSSPASFTDVFFMKMDLPLDGYKTYIPNVFK